MSEPRANAAESVAVVTTDAEAVLFRLVRDGYLIEQTENSIRLKRRDGEAVSLPWGLKDSVSKHKHGIRMLINPVNPEAAKKLFHDVLMGLSMRYPRGVGCDLSVATEILIRSEEAYEAGDIALWRYRLHVGCKKALAICAAHANMNPFYEQEALT